MEDEKQHLIEDSRERLSINSQIIIDKSFTIDECLQSYYKVTGKKYVGERSFQNLVKILQVKGLNEIETLRFQLLNLQREDENKAQESVNFQKQTEKLAEERFIKSDEYKYVKQFAKKYGNKAENSELENLKALLSKHQYYFSVDQLREFIQDENWQKLDNFLNERVFINNPSTIREAIVRFLEHCNPDDIDMVISFAFLLKKNGFQEIVSVDGNNVLIDFLRAKIKKVEEEIKLEGFEQRLSEENEQVWLEDIDQFNGYKFEDFLKNLFTRMGYRVKQTKLSGDQGADLVVVKLGEVIAVQAKRSDGKIGNKAIQEIVAAMNIYHARKGMVVTNNYFTPAAIELAQANYIELIDRDGLEELINNYW